MFGPSKRTTSPIVTGTSVVAVKYAGGVMMAADTLGSYGSLAMFTDLRRMIKVTDSILVGGGGDYSDFQQVQTLIEEVVRDERLAGGEVMSAPELHSFLGRVFYNRRNRMDPYWNSILVAGFKDGVSSLGVVDKIGSTYSEDFLATGFGSHIAIPIIRAKWTPDMSEEEARTLLEDCMRVLYYRDCRALNKIQLSKVDATGVLISEPYALETKWDYKSFVKPKAGVATGGSW